MRTVVNIRNTGRYFERTNTLVDYFNDIRKFDNSFSNEDEEAIFNLIKNGNKKEREQARKSLVEANQRFVVSVAKAYATNNNLMDLIDEGNIGLMEAIDAYDPNIKIDGKSVRFITFAVHYIRRAITQYKINHDTLVRKSNISKTLHVVARARNKFIQEHGRQPTTDELKDEVNADFNIKIKKSIDLYDLKVSSIDESAGDSDDDATMGDMALFNSYSANGNNYDKNVSKEYNKELVVSMLKVLTPREQNILKMSFGLGYERPLTPIEIGEKVHLTPERVRQMKTTILKRLKSEFKRKLNQYI